jgi:hypothetical protein
MMHSVAAAAAAAAAPSRAGRVIISSSRIAVQQACSCVDAGGPQVVPRQRNSWQHCGLSVLWHAKQNFVWCCCIWCYSLLMCKQLLLLLLAGDGDGVDSAVGRLWLLAWPLSWMEVLTFAKELIITSYVGHLGAAELSALVLAQTVYNVTGNAP